MYHNEGKSASEITKIMSINRWIVYRTIKCYRETDSTQDRFRKGRPRFARTPAVMKVIRERVRKNPVRNIQGLAKDLHISTRSVGRKIKEDIGLKCYKFREVQLLSETNKKCRYEQGRIKAISFYCRNGHNRQNSRILNPDQKYIRQCALLKELASVMVWSNYF